MITSKLESFVDTYDELLPLLQCHHDELNDPELVLDIDMGVYGYLEGAGNLVTAIARDDDKIVGFMVCGVSQMTHHKTETIMSTDSFHIKKDYRNRGVALELHDLIEKECNKRGITKWFAGVKSHTTASQFMEKAGFEKHEIIYMRSL
jgi:L-amino acid N-acyltransferase YncA